MSPIVLRFGADLPEHKSRVEPRTRERAAAAQVAGWVVAERFEDRAQIHAHELRRPPSTRTKRLNHDLRHQSLGAAASRLGPPEWGEKRSKAQHVLLHEARIAGVLSFERRKSRVESGEIAP